MGERTPAAGNAAGVFRHSREVDCRDEIVDVHNDPNNRHCLGRMGWRKEEGQALYAFLGIGCIIGAGLGFISLLSL
jgi:hypothetical protein